MKNALFFKPGSGRLEYGVIVAVQGRNGAMLAEEFTAEPKEVRLQLGSRFIFAREREDPEEARVYPGW